MKIYILYFIIIIITLIILNTKFYSDINEYFNIRKCNFDHPILSKKDLLDLKDILLEFKRYCTMNNIDYFATGGTLIGTVRHGGLMPLDDDIDFGIFNKDTYYFENYNKIMSNSNFYIKPIFFGYKLFKKSSNNNNDSVFIDIFVFELKNDKYMIKGGKWKNEAIEIDEIYPLLNMKYNNIDISIPNKYIKYLDRAFPKWDTLMKLQCNHIYKSRGCIYKKELNLNNDYPINDNNKYTCYSSFD